ncbi:DUF7344 domain-containing protein [Natronobiforma cellulositropha]|uniref:DUF7344 domain-containing protein n=1 Tax=Natronobiforma cellulositropha TaxID=1679076 RepID=UPI0021D5EAC8|nr:hypothetical protein [Natronobiforma cellulositropha]
MTLADSVLDRLEDRGVGDSRPDETDAEDASSALSTDDIFHILQTKRRRDVLRYLRDAGTAVRMRDLAEQVAAWEQETTIERLSSSERQRVYISLYQSHLPKLDEEGIVDYDKDRGIVERAPLAARFDPFLDHAERATAPLRDPWPRRYAFSIGAGALVLASASAGYLPLSGSVAGALAIAIVALVTAVHAYETHIGR